MASGIPTCAIGVIGYDDKLPILDLLIYDSRNEADEMVAKMSKRLIINEDVEWLKGDQPEEKNLLLSARKFANFALRIQQDGFDFAGCCGDGRHVPERQFDKVLDPYIKDMRWSLG
jgi:hypothetical protein